MVGWGGKIKDDSSQARRTGHGGSRLKLSHHRCSDESRRGNLRRFEVSGAPNFPYWPGDAQSRQPFAASILIGNERKQSRWIAMQREDSLVPFRPRLQSSVE